MLTLNQYSFWQNSMALDRNPTKTRSIEKAWLREINKRWRMFGKDITKKFNEINNHAIKVNKAVAMNPAQVRIYMDYVNQRILDLLLGTEQAPNWQARYQLESYLRALQRTEGALRAQGLSMTPSGAERAAATLLQPRQFTATATLATSTAQLGPIHTEAIEFLYVRSYESLNGWTDALSREIRQISMEAIQIGAGARETTRKILERTDVSRSRAQLIARTETIQAHQHGTQNETKRAEEFLNEDIGMRWLTVKDSRVRDLHANWHGTIATTEQNAKRIVASPYNCRCAQVPVIPEANTPKRQEKFDKEREQLLQMVGE
jgi:SPP1 gp7 family putative phage head morphogenesis protein